VLPAANAAPAPAQAAGATAPREGAQADAPGRRPGNLEVDQASRVAAPGETFSVARRAGERAKEYRARVEALQARYARGRAQLEQGEAAGAVATLEALLADEPGQPDAQELLAVAREREAAQKRAEAQAVFDAATALETAGELREAEQQYATLRGAATAPAGVDEAITRVRARRVELGNQALANAKQFHSIGSRLADATREYERALYLLPDDHPNHAVARERLDALRGIRRQAEVRSG
jgi:tetratricopeptide (TPR) repeat protein